MRKLMMLVMGAGLVLAWSVAMADVPVTMQFQGYLTDSDNEPMEGEHTLTFTLYGAQDGSDVVWSDTQVMALQSGAFTALLGGESNPLDANIFGSDPLWMGITVDGGAELSPRSPVTSVPYATRAALADNAMTQEQVQAILDDQGYLTEYTETDPTVNSLATASLSCDTGNVAKWDGASWSCAVDEGLTEESDPTVNDLARATFGCAAGQVVKWDGAAWACGDDMDTIVTDTDTLGQLICANGYVAKYNADTFAWECAADEGLTEESDPTVNDLARTTLACGNGEIPRFNGVSWECSPDVNTDMLADIVCGEEQILRWNGTAWACSNDNDTIVENTDLLASLNCEADGSVVLWNIDSQTWECGMSVLSETDPEFNASQAAGIEAADINRWNEAHGWGDHANAGYLTSYTETDPQYAASVASGIAAGDVASWNMAYGWGDHAAAGYMTSYTETDPQYAASVAAGIVAGEVASWNAAYGWGDHAAAGYMTSYTETDPVYGASVAAGISSGQVDNWNEAHSWGDHATFGYMTSYTEADPNFIASAAAGITAGDVVHWSEAYGWGDHAAAGYMTSYAETDPQVGSLTTGRFPVWSGSTLNDANMYQAPAGWIGINNTSPEVALDVNGDIRANRICDENGANCRDLSVAGATDGHSLDAADGVPVDAVYVDNDGVMKVNNYSIMKFDDNGHQAEATAYDFGDPGVVIENAYGESGGFFANNDTAAIWSATNTGMIVEFLDEDGMSSRSYIDSGGQLMMSSDRKLKENIEPLKDSLDKVMQMEGKRYKFKLLPGEKEKGQVNKMQVGLIAQDVVKVVPEVVDYQERNDQYYINYAALVPVLIEAMKEQQKQIETLQQQVQALSQQN